MLEINVYYISRRDNNMLLNFSVKNYRSIKEEVCLDFEATGLSDDKSCFLKYKNKNYLPVISINGKNGGGKSNFFKNENIINKSL